MAAPKKLPTWLPIDIPAPLPHKWRRWSTTQPLLWWFPAKGLGRR